MYKLESLLTLQITMYSLVEVGNESVVLSTTRNQISIALKTPV
jgi:hypothetical protein